MSNGEAKERFWTLKAAPASEGLPVVEFSSGSAVPGWAQYDFGPPQEVAVHNLVSYHSDDGRTWKKKSADDSTSHRYWRVVQFAEGFEAPDTFEDDLSDEDENDEKIEAVASLLVASVETMSYSHARSLAEEIAAIFAEDSE